MTRYIQELARRQSAGKRTYVKKKATRKERAARKKTARSSLSKIKESNAEKKLSSRAVSKAQSSLASSKSSKDKRKALSFQRGRAKAISSHVSSAGRRKQAKRDSK